MHEEEKQITPQELQEALGGVRAKPWECPHGRSPCRTRSCAIWRDGVGGRMAGSRGEWREVSSRDTSEFLNLLLMTPSAPGLWLVRGRQQVHFVRVSCGFHRPAPG